jgi:hypothetical protein
MVILIIGSRSINEFTAPWRLPNGTVAAAQFQGRPAEPGVDGWKVAPFFFFATVKGIQHDSINKSWDILYLFYFGYTCILLNGICFYRSSRRLCAKHHQSKVFSK